MKFKAIIVEEVNGKYFRHVGERAVESLPAGDVLIKVLYSSLNYKDALSAAGHKGVTKNYPHTPGIDAGGIIVDSRVPQFKAGDQVLVTGYDLGMNTSGGFAEYICVPQSWVVPLPGGLDIKESMILGTAGFTAALSLLRLENNGLRNNSGPVLVTGATGGVGSAAIAILSRAGYSVCAATRKPVHNEFLRKLGAAEIINTDELISASQRPLSRGRWQGAVDTVGGSVLEGVIASLQMFGSVASCGLTKSPNFQTTVYPFILRGNNLLGINSAETPMELRLEIWDRLAGIWKPDFPENYFSESSLENLLPKLEEILDGNLTGRTVINLL